MSPSGAESALARFNQLALSQAEARLTQCCGSSAWVAQLVDRRPFESVASLSEASREAFAALAEYDWLEAFSHHPRIGDLKALKEKFAATAGWASGEQSGALGASEETLRALAAGNDDYLSKFGFVFLVCATGKGADEMLYLLRARLPHTREEELRLAGIEQQKITALRLEKLLRELDSP